MGNFCPNKHTKLCWQLGFNISYPVGGETYHNGDEVSVTLQIGSSGISHIMEVDVYAEDGKYYGPLITDQPVKGRSEVTLYFKLSLVRGNFPSGKYNYAAIGSYSFRGYCTVYSHLFNIVS